MAQLNFGIHEMPHSDGVRLSLTGELDLVTAPILEQRVEQLRIEGHGVRLDLSRLEFIDSTGIHVLVKAISSANSNGWRFAIEPDIASHVARVFSLVKLDQFLHSGS
jgi:anti-sigma B factor antagonist